jgi:hypothetical protein
VENSCFSCSIYNGFAYIKFSRSICLVNRLYATLVGSSLLISITYRIIRISVDEDAPTPPERFDYLFFDKTISLDDFNTLTSQTLGFLRIGVASDTADLEGLGFILEERLDDTSALRTSCPIDSDEFGRSHDEDEWERLLASRYDCVRFAWNWLLMDILDFYGQDTSLYIQT